ncbi:hypothetical protein BZA77DRAFT_296948 [Pyronema omphalodes]|nr:hypothetical protein BZA77DRAFT_296948 [Pyronema omphalodes]
MQRVYEETNAPAFKRGFHTATMSLTGSRLHIRRRRGSRESHSDLIRWKFRLPSFFFQSSDSCATSVSRTPGRPTSSTPGSLLEDCQEQAMQLVVTRSLSLLEINLKGDKVGYQTGHDKEDENNGLFYLLDHASSLCIVIIIYNITVNLSLSFVTEFLNAESPEWKKHIHLCMERVEP